MEEEGKPLDTSIFQTILDSDEKDYFQDDGTTVLSPKARHILLKLYHKLKAEEGEIRLFATKPWPMCTFMDAARHSGLLKDNPDGTRKISNVSMYNWYQTYYKGVREEDLDGVFENKIAAKFSKVKEYRMLSRNLTARRIRGTWSKAVTQLERNRIEKLTTPNEGVKITSCRI